MRRGGMKYALPYGTFLALAALVASLAGARMSTGMSVSISNFRLGLPQAHVHSPEFQVQFRFALLRFGTHSSSAGQVCRGRYLISHSA